MLPLLGLSLASLVAAPSAKLDALVARVIEAYGGEAALAKIRVRRDTGSLESRRGTAKTVRVFAPPDRLRVEIAYQGGETEVRVVDGARGYRNGEKVSGMPYDAMVLQAARLDLPGLLLRNRAKAMDLGEADRKAGKVHCVGIPLSGRLALAIEIDPKTARIVRSEGALPGGPSGQVRFATEYSDFREASGVLFAFHEANFASGQHTAETQLEKIELLEEAPKGAFEPQ